VHKNKSQREKFKHICSEKSKKILISLSKKIV
jgi:hypothetical protein